MPDRIEINGLMVTTVVGALPHEREIAQPLRVDLSLVVDLHDAGRSDELGDTVHYGEVTDRVAAVVRENKDVLLERLADRIAEVVVGFDRVEAVELTVTKLRPPIAEHVETTSVSIRRTRAEYDVAPRSSHRAIVALGSNLGDRESYLWRGRSTGWVTSSPRRRSSRPTRSAAPTPRAPTSTWSPSSTRHSTRSPSSAGASASRRRRCVSAPSAGDRARSMSTCCSTTTSTIDSPELTIPHPRIGERRFVLAPLAEVAPERCPQGWDDTLPPAAVHPRGPLR